MTPDLLRRAAEALYGERWQTALALELGVADRTVRRWLSGDHQPPPGVWHDLRRLVAERGAQLQAIAAEIDRL